MADYFSYVSNSSCSLRMETFFDIARYKGQGQALKFNVLISWESISSEIYEHWATEASQTRVKFVILDADKTICLFNLDADFLFM